MLPCLILDDFNPMQGSRLQIQGLLKLIQEDHFAILCFKALIQEGRGEVFWSRNQTGVG